MTYTELQDRSRLVTIGLWVTIGIHILSSLLSAYGIHLFDQMNNGREYDMQTLTFYDDMVGFLAMGNLMVFIFTAVTFVRWMLAAFDILISRGMIMPYDRGFIAWAFFIPFANFVRPYQAISSIYDGVLQMAGVSPTRERSFVLPWWLLYIIGGVIGNISFRLSLSADSLDEYTTFLYLDLIAAIMYLGSAWLILQVISNYSSVVGQAIENDRIDMIGQEPEEQF